MSRIIAHRLHQRERKRNKIKKRTKIKREDKTKINRLKKVRERVIKCICGLRSSLSLGAVNKKPYCFTVFCFM